MIDHEDLHIMIQGMVAMVINEMYNMPQRIKVKIVDPSIPTELPVYATEGSSGVDLRSVEEIIILPNETKMIKTNLSVGIPRGYELQIRSRSGISAKYSVFVLNGIGTIDSDYTGEILVILHNIGKEAYPIAKNDRIAQAVLCKVERMEFEKVDELSDTERGSGGFGHTGK